MQYEKIVAIIVCICWAIFLTRTVWLWRKSKRRKPQDHYFAERKKKDDLPL
jgi:hypothetical protein